MSLELVRAVKNGNLALVEQLIRNGHDVNFQPKSNDAPYTYHSPLHTAVEVQNLPIVCFLIQQGADVNLGTLDCPLYNPLCQLIDQFTCNNPKPINNLALPGYLMAAGSTLNGMGYSSTTLEFLINRRKKTEDYDKVIELFL